MPTNSRANVAINWPCSRIRGGVAMPPISGAMLTFIGYAPDFTFLNSQLRNPVVNKKDEVKV